MVPGLMDREVDQKIVELVARARQDHGLAEECDGRTACTKLGFKLAHGTLPSGTDGMWSGRQVIIDRRIRWKPRVEFTIFHEITHHLLDEDGEIIEHYTTLLRNDQAGYEKAVERCCDKGAAEFLMPRDRVRDLISAKSFSVDLVEDIADTHGSSVIASALQLAHCAPVDCFVVLCSEGVIPKWKPRRRGLYADYVGAPPRRKFILRRFSPIQGDHVLAQAFKDQRVVAGETYVPYPSKNYMPCYCEAKPLGPFIAGILYFEKPPPQEQMAFEI